MSAPNSGMTLHSLVLIVDRFSLHCNSIQSPVSIVHLRVILTYLIPLLRVYINYSISNAIQFQLVQQCIQISTRINSSMYIVHTSFVSFETPLHLHFRSAMVCWPIIQQCPGAPSEDFSVNGCFTVVDPGGPRGPLGPVKISHKKDGHRMWLQIFHVSWPPPTRPLDPLLVSGNFRQLITLLK